MNPKDFTRAVREHGKPVKAAVVADIIDDLAAQGEALERERDQARRDLEAAVVDRNRHHARYIEADGALCRALNERDEARALLIEEQKARHAAGTRVALLERLLREAQHWVQEGPPSAKGLDDVITAALTPPSPAGASGQPSGSTPAASSATFSSSEAAGNPSAPHGTLEGGAA